jgi:hypothetical protein
VVWGKHDPSFTLAGAVAYAEDVAIRSFFSRRAWET